MTAHFMHSGAPIQSRWQPAAGRRRKESHMAQSISIALMILLAVPAGVSFAQDAASEAPIRAIVADQVVAWNAGDGQSYARHLAPDASFTNRYKGTTKYHFIRRIRFRS
jgi:hypothetical protein